MALVIVRLWGRVEPLPWPKIFYMFCTKMNVNKNMFQNLQNILVLNFMKILINLVNEMRFVLKFKGWYFAICLQKIK